MKKSLFFLILVFILSSCQQAPKPIEKGEVNKATNKNEKRIEQEIKDEGKIEKNLLSLPKTLEKTYKGNKNTLNINANINALVPKDFNLYTYYLNTNQISKELQKKIIKTYFGDKSDQVFYNEKLCGYMFGDDKILGSEYVTFLDHPNLILISAHKKNLNSFEDNIISNKEKSNFNISLDNGIDICKNFLEEIGLSNYSFDYAVPFGKIKGEHFYEINFCLFQNDMPVVCKENKTKFSFWVTNEGIYRIKGQLITLKEKEKISNIISLDTAIKNLESEIDNISLFYGQNSIFSNKVDSLGNMTIYPICEIKLEYIIRSQNNKDYIATPAWRFIIGEKEKYIDRDKILAVDAITGEIIFK